MEEYKITDFKWKNVYFYGKEYYHVIMLDVFLSLIPDISGLIIPQIHAGMIDAFVEHLSNPDTQSVWFFVHDFLWKIVLMYLLITLSNFVHAILIGKWKIKTTLLN